MVIYTHTYHGHTQTLSMQHSEHRLTSCVQHSKHLLSPVGTGVWTYRQTGQLVSTHTHTHTHTNTSLMSETSLNSNCAFYYQAKYG